MFSGAEKGPGPGTSGRGPGPGTSGPGPGPGTSGFSQLLALAAEVAVLIKNESHYALRDSTADTNYSNVKEGGNG